MIELIKFLIKYQDVSKLFSYLDYKSFVMLRLTHSEFPDLLTDYLFENASLRIKKQLLANVRLKTNPNLILQSIQSPHFSMIDRFNGLLQIAHLCDVKINDKTKIHIAKLNKELSEAKERKRLDKMELLFTQWIVLLDKKAWKTPIEKQNGLEICVSSLRDRSEDKINKNREDLADRFAKINQHIPKMSKKFFDFALNILSKQEKNTLKLAFHLLNIIRPQLTDEQITKILSLIKENFLIKENVMFFLESQLFKTKIEIEIAILDFLSKVATHIPDATVDDFISSVEKFLKINDPVVLQAGLLFLANLVPKLTTDKQITKLFQLAFKNFRYADSKISQPAFLLLTALAPKLDDDRIALTLASIYKEWVKPNETSAIARPPENEAMVRFILAVAHRLDPKQINAIVEWKLIKLEDNDHRHPIVQAAKEDLLSYLIITGKLNKEMLIKISASASAHSFLIQELIQCLPRIKPGIDTFELKREMEKRYKDYKEKDRSKRSEVFTEMYSYYQSNGLFASPKSEDCFQISSIDLNDGKRNSV